jgi:hypothetical protein
MGTNRTPLPMGVYSYDKIIKKHLMSFYVIYIFTISLQYPTHKMSQNFNFRVLEIFFWIWISWLFSSVSYGLQYTQGLSFTYNTLKVYHLLTIYSRFIIYLSSNKYFILNLYCSHTTLCDKICQGLATGRWFSPVSSTNKTDRHNITEILLKVAFNSPKTIALQDF